MGCYGIGINRIVAGLVETNNDAAGIIWPVSVAPYEALVVPVNVADEPTRQAAERIYEQLSAAGVEAMLDDRDVRAGVKFKDADLIGFPLRVVIGDRGLKQGKIEIKWRWDGKPEMIELEGAVEKIAAMIAAERADGRRFREAQQRRSRT